MAKLTVADFGFLAVETIEGPAHVAGLQIFEVPPGTSNSEKFVQDLFAALTEQSECTPPFNQKLKAPLVGMPEWVPDDNLELSYHVRYSVLPSPGSREQLYELISRLHANLLDRSRPLWEFHLISGMEGGRFAIYAKIHHALVDGISGMRLMQNVLTTSADDKTVIAPWAQPPRQRRKREAKSFLDELLGVPKKLRKQVDTTIDLHKIALKLSTQALGIGRDKLPIPFTASTTALDVPLSKARVFASAQFPFERMKAIGKTAQVTLNDVMLTICDMGVHWYLNERGTPAKEPMVCQVPVSLRREGEVGGNKITIAMVRLGDSDAAPRERLREINRSMTDFKEVFGDLEPEALMTYGLLTQGLADLVDKSKFSERLPPFSNMIMSNVPGPRETFYLNGAPMVELYPVSMMGSGLSFNITVNSYAGSMFMGIIAGRNAAPQLSRMAEHMQDAFETLEEAVMGKSA